MKTLLALLVIATGCAAPVVPYTTESTVGRQSRHWASSQGSITKRVTVHNPVAKPVIAKVVCDGDIFEGEGEHYFALAPYGYKGDEVYALISVPVKYQVGDACSSPSYEVGTPQGLP